MIEIPVSSATADRAATIVSTWSPTICSCSSNARDLSSLQFTYSIAGRRTLWEPEHFILEKNPRLFNFSEIHNCRCTVLQLLSNFPTSAIVPPTTLQLQFFASLIKTSKWERKYPEWPATNRNRSTSDWLQSRLCRVERCICKKKFNLKKKFRRNYKTIIIKLTDHRIQCLLLAPVELRRGSQAERDADSRPAEAGTARKSRIARIWPGN